MSFWQRLWNDDGGAVVTAELAVLATVGVIGGVVGLSTFAHAVNAELTDAAFAFRSLDQSYSYYGFSSRGAWVAGSAYTQVDVATAHAELATVAGVEASAHARAEATAEAHGQGGGHVPCEVVPCPPDLAPSLRPQPEADRRHDHGHHDAERHERHDESKRPPGEPRKAAPSADDLPDPPKPKLVPKRRNERDDRRDDGDDRRRRRDDQRDDARDRRNEA